MFPSKGSDLNKATTATKPLRPQTHLPWFLSCSFFFFPCHFLTASWGLLRLLGPWEKPVSRTSKVWTTLVEVLSSCSVVFISHCSSPESLTSRDEASRPDVHLPRFQTRGPLSPPLKVSWEGFSVESKVGGPDVAEPSHSQDPYSVFLWWRFLCPNNIKGLLVQLRVIWVWSWQAFPLDFNSREFKCLIHCLHIYIFPLNLLWSLCLSKIRSLCLRKTACILTFLCGA